MPLLVDQMSSMVFTNPKSDLSNRELYHIIVVKFCNIANLKPKLWGIIPCIALIELMGLAFYVDSFSNKDLSSSSYRGFYLFVVGPSRAELGVITLGDLRKWLLRCI